jgi:transposase
LRKAARTGRPAKLDAAQLHELEQALRQGPEAWDMPMAYGPRGECAT